jgi:hypothetical protein
VRYLRLYSDADGVSQFDEVEVEFTQAVADVHRSR